MDDQHDREDNAERPPARVLVFDDNDLDRFALCLALHQSGIGGFVHDTGSELQAIEWIETTRYDCVYIGDSTARTHPLSILVALNRVGYRGRIEIVAYGLESAPHGAAAMIDFVSIARLTPERLAASCGRR
jgi:hypothetical protein